MVSAGKRGRCCGFSRWKEVGVDMPLWIFGQLPQMVRTALVVKAPRTFDSATCTKGELEASVDESEF